MRIRAYMLSCAARDGVRTGTLMRLAATDWGDGPVVVLDDGLRRCPEISQTRAARCLLETARAERAEFVLFLEDDLMFNRHLRHNLTRWHPLASADPDGHLMASLYDPGVGSRTWDHARAFSIARPELVYGSQAFVLSRATVAHVLDGWERVAGKQDLRIARLAAETGPIHYHRPSLIQHATAPSTWGGPSHRAADFSMSWRARGGA